MEPSQPVSPNVRMRELLAVPDRERSEAQWDELIELEIMLAPENREGAPQHKSRRNANGDHGSSGNKRYGNRSVKKADKRSRKRKAPR